MKNSNAAFNTFIDKKFIPLAPKIKVAVTIALIILPVAIFYFASFQPAADKITNLQNQKENLQKEIQEVERKVADLKKFEKELEEATAAFEEASVLLPKDK